jgi:hypothetical protein
MVCRNLIFTSVKTLALVQFGALLIRRASIALHLASQNMCQIFCSLLVGMVVTIPAPACWLNYWTPPSIAYLPPARHDPSVRIPPLDAPAPRVDLVFLNSKANAQFRIDVDGYTVFPLDPTIHVPPQFTNLVVGKNHVNGICHVGQKLTIYLYENKTFVRIIRPELIVPKAERTFDLQKGTWSK